MRVAANSRALVAAALAYAAVYGAWTWPLALSPATHVPIAAEHVAEGAHEMSVAAGYDQWLTIWGVKVNARSWLRLEPRKLIDHGLCWPTADAAFLGEHMIEAGLLGIPGYVASGGDPLASYNAACLLAVVLAGTGAFALVRHWTGSAAAGFVAGLLFAFHPARVSDLVHLAVVGNHWTPWVLLAFEKLLERGRARDAAALAATASLQALTGAYPLIALGVFAAPFGLVRLVQRRSLVDARRLVLLVAAICVTAAVLAALLVPYTAGQQTWKALRTRMMIFTTAADLLRPGFMATGVVALVLAAIGVIARLAGRAVGAYDAIEIERTPRGRVAAATLVERGADPTAAVLAGTLAALLFATDGVPWPGGPSILPLYSWASALVAQMEFVRVPAAVRFSFYLGVVMLAGLGVAALLRRVSSAARPALTAALACAALAEVLVPSLAERSFGRDHTVALRALAPDRAALDVYAAFDRAGYDGGVLDVPYGAWVPWREMPPYVLWAAYHGRPIAACYNSFLSPSYFAIKSVTQNLATEAADPAAIRGRVEALAAAGLRNVVVHEAGTTALTDAFAGAPGVETLARSAGIAAFRLHAEPAVTHDLGALAPAGLRVPPLLEHHRFIQFVYVDVRNASEATFALGRPLTPLSARVRFVRDGQPLAWNDVTALPPVGLAPGAVAEIAISAAPLPEPGTYQVDVEVPTLGWKLTPADAVTVRP